MEEKYNNKLPEVHDAPERASQGCRRIQRRADRRDVDVDISQLKKYYGDHNDELQLPMDLLFNG